MRTAPATAGVGGDGQRSLRAMLILLTVVTGLVDAFSYLMLGHVFVANMTGNIVFLAFAVGGAPGFVWWASVLAIAVFMLGASAGGAVFRRGSRPPHRDLLIASVIQLALFVAAAVVAFVSAGDLRAGYDEPAMAVLIVLLGAGMGIQNAAARALRVPDLTTTVLTLTVVGLAADQGRERRIGPRVLSITSMFVGAVVGVVLIVHEWVPWVLVLASVIILAVVVCAWMPPRGHRPPAR
ncbi:YoaK family protein [Microbacterium allomyrinae]|uniref:DUF1275 domain-containing protein n=1 Tax=Microbacterium allomyrinae TaxID=2830666 RepID=A0A9X1LWG6_9MICO|nr:YoaK family protein [Microbacterium allomyrinae]MCC2033137.1 DUF1275 domain-containing protein [Microbacterium allomyrinae]